MKFAVCRNIIIKLRDSNSNRPFRFYSNVMGWFKNFLVGYARPLLVIVKQLKPLTALSGPVYRLASSMSDHTPVLFNVFEDWNEESVVLHISIVSFVINYIYYWLLNAWFDSYSVGPWWNMLSGTRGWFFSRFDSNSNRNARFDSRFDSNANGWFAGPYVFDNAVYLTTGSPTDRWSKVAEEDLSCLWKRRMQETSVSLSLFVSVLCVPSVQLWVWKA